MTGNTQDMLLIAEDSDEDFELIEEIMLDLAVENPIHRCEDGDEILRFLKAGELQSGQLQSGQLQSGELQSGGLQMKRIQSEGSTRSTAQSQRPAVILLDLNLPGTDGRQVLAQLKQDAALQEIPIVVFTTSSNPSDIEFCYRHGANGYLIKPMDLDDLQTTLRGFIDYWLDLNVSPL